MRNLFLAFGLAMVSIALGLVAGVEQDGISSGRRRSIFKNSAIFSKHKTPMHKAIFTQRGYIQFLRWELPVPEIDEFTFCLWVKSVNLTYTHSIFSYSKDEKERWVRSWISPFGRSIHLEIGGTEIMAHPTQLEEHRWYHICQSWENQNSRYALWIDGRIEVEGYAAELMGHVIPSNGDLVVGQEYTDFDKGFEDGIEGAVVGFNLLLKSAFQKSAIFFPPSIRNDEENLRSVLSLDDKNRSPPRYPFSEIIESGESFPLGIEIHPGIEIRRNFENSPGLIPHSENQQGRKFLPEKRGEGTFEKTLKEYLGDQETFRKRNYQRRSSDGQRVTAPKFTQRTKRNTRRIRRRGEKQPLGLQLIDLTYNHCEIGRGSPFIGGSKMLISWTRTPVKVVGGTIIKNVESNCGNF